MRHLPIFLSLILPAAVQAVAFYHPPDRIPDRDPSINPFQRRINNSQSDAYTCACVTTGSQPETGHGLQQIAKRSDLTGVEKRIDNPNAVLESPLGVAPPVASTCLCPATTAAAPVVNQAPPVASVSPVEWKEPPVPAVPAPNNAPPAQVSYITVQTTVTSYSTVQQPVQPKPLQTVYQTHFITSIVKAPHATAATSHDDGKSSDGASAISKEVAPEVGSASVTDADDAPSSTAKGPVIPTSTAKIVLNVDKLIVIESDDDDGRFRVMHVNDQPQPDEFPPLNREKKTINMMIYWIDDPNSSDPLFESHELELDGIEAQEKTVTFDVKQGELKPQKKDGVSFACEKKAKVANYRTSGR